MNSFLKYFQLLALIAFSVSCGGTEGGNDGDQISSALMVTPDFAPSTITNSIVSTSAASLSVTHTKELKSEDGFLFRSSEDLSISIDIKSSSKKPDRISVCGLDEVNHVDLSGCLYSGGFRGEYFTKKFTVPNDVESLAVVLWFFEPELQQLVYSWNKSTGNDWRIEL